MHNAPAQDASEFELYGQILWLWGQSRLHHNWPIASAMQYVISPISERQFLLLKDSAQMPRAYASWAFLSQEAELRYIKDPTSLQASDWRSGDRLWFIDFIAPFGFGDVAALRRQLGKLHAHKFLGRSIRLHAGSSSARVGEHAAGSADLARSQELKRKYFQDLHALIH